MGGFDEKAAQNDAGASLGGTRRRGRSLKKTVALIGLMGAGKSSIGRRLAGRIGAAFRDADTEVERAAAMTIPEIFEAYGEPHFRDGERRVIERLLGDPPHVLATGGGAYMDPRTRATLADRAITVWLRADLDTLVMRVGRRDSRPLLKHGDVRETLSRLIDQRYPVYANADLIVESRDAPHDEALSDLIAALERFGAFDPAPATDDDAG